MERKAILVILIQCLWIQMLGARSPIAGAMERGLGQLRGQSLEAILVGRGGGDEGRQHKQK